MSNVQVLSDCVMQLRQLDTECDDEDNGWDKEVDGEVANGELPGKTNAIKPDHLTNRMSILIPLQNIPLTQNLIIKYV